MVASNGISLQEFVYFGSVWQYLQKEAGDVPIPLGGGFSVAQTIRSSDGVLFAGIAERRDASGAITDVVLTFTGAFTADDFAEAGLIIAGLPSTQVQAAEAIYDAVMANPAYLSARINVTGHSLGSGLAQFLLGHSLATYGTAITDARTEFVQFGPTGFLSAAATHYGLSESIFAGRMTGYLAANDITTDAFGGSPMGVVYELEAYTPYGGALAMLDASAAHQAYTYIDGLGLPDWLDEAAINEIAMRLGQRIMTARDPDYGPPGTVGMTIQGDAAANDLRGFSGEDILIGAGGADVLTGGAGADRFVFSSAQDSGSTTATADRITDFHHGEDKIDFSGLATNAGHDLTFIGARPFSASGQVRTYHTGNFTYLAVNLDGDTSPELIVALDGRLQVTADDLVLVNRPSFPEVSLPLFLV